MPQSFVVPRRHHRRHGQLRSRIRALPAPEAPISYTRRTATRDAEVGGKTIRKGDKVATWYVSANRDEAVW